MYQLSLTLILHVTTATAERSFSAMNAVKSRLCNKKGDQWLNDNLVVYIEKEISDNNDDEIVMQRFQGMKTRHMHF